jgi:hypothetical protein
MRFRLFGSSAWPDQRGRGAMLHRASLNTQLARRRGCSAGRSPSARGRCPHTRQRSSLQKEDMSDSDGECRSCRSCSRFPTCHARPLLPWRGPSFSGCGRRRQCAVAHAQASTLTARMPAHQPGDLSMDSSSESENEGPRPVVGGKVRALARYRTHNAPRWRRLLRSLRGR